MMSTSFFERQPLLYQYVLESGVARGSFVLGEVPAETVACGPVKLEMDWAFKS